MYYHQDDKYEIRGLLDSTILLPSVQAVVDHCAEGGFDLCGAVFSKCGWGEDVDEVMIIKLVNFMRAFVRDYCGERSSIGKCLELALNEDITHSFSDILMVPTLHGDDLLFLLPEYVQSTPYSGKEQTGGECITTISVASGPAVDSDVSEMSQMREKLERCESLIQRLTADDDLPGKQLKSKAVVPLESDADYFGSYSHLEIHEVMLTDRHRTESYAAAIAANEASIRGKIVLDVGCGTGILSMLAARNGAKMVIGIDVSKILDKTRTIVKRNGYEDVVKLLQGRVEDSIAEILSLLPEDGKVDCIISEWMVRFLSRYSTLLII